MIYTKTTQLKLTTATAYTKLTSQPTFTKSVTL